MSGDETLERARRAATHGPSLAIAMLGFFLLGEAWEPSSQPAIFMFSYLRLTAVAALALVAAYGIASLWSRTLASLNGGVVYTVVVGSLLVEAVLRAAPSLISDDLMLLLPASARVRLAAERGLFTRDLIVGDGLFFRWKPHAAMVEQPSIVIDENGYRNDGPIGDFADVVLLGASVLYAPTVERDLGRRLRDAGVRALSLAFAAYGPDHYREAYRRFVIDRNVAHRKVLVLVMTPYDLDKAIEYQRVKANRGTYQDLLAPPPTVGSIAGDKAPLWILSIYGKLPIFIAQKIQGAWRAGATMVAVRFDYATIPMPETVFDETPRETGWPPFEAALRDILSIARSHGAEPIVLYYPEVSLTALPYVEGHDEKKQALENDYRETVSRLGTIVARHGGRFVDSTPWFRERVRTEPLTVSPLNYHLNQRGTDVLLEFVLPWLRT